MALTINYHDLEERVFLYLQSRQKQNPDVGFSMRVKAGKGSETDYFIGTTKSNYFGFTLWGVYVSFPGSSNDLFDFFVQRKNGKWKISFQGNQIIAASDQQNRLALKLAQDSWEILSHDLDSSKYHLIQHREENKYFRYQIEPVYSSYETVEELLFALGELIDDIRTPIDQLIRKAKQENPDFIAGIYNQQDYENMLERLEKRFKRYGKNPLPISMTQTSKIGHESMQSESNHPLNQILYGPPGTGKTYHTINRALEILGINLNQPRAELKRLFDEKVKDGQIVFTTFHQSMSYEDFVEGIKPVDNSKEEKPISYKVASGILKRMCEKIKADERMHAGASSKSTSFEGLYNAFITRLRDILSGLDDNEIHFFPSRKSRVKLLSIDDNDIVTIGETASSEERITQEKLKRIYNEFKSPDEITNIPKQIRAVGTDIGWTTNYFAVFKAFKEFEQANKKDLKNELGKKIEKPHILIIDEINRGNVSQIFGELITLIEEDKRLGREEALEVTLPYSKEKFGVPDNLYIIGTMNTADRSVEALDVALRRRFSFEEMPPRPELLHPARRFWQLLWDYEKVDWEHQDYKPKEKALLDWQGANETIWKSRMNIWDKMKAEGKNDAQSQWFNESDFNGLRLDVLLSTINNRIAYLLDKDHQIGHSYFIKVTSEEALREVFKKNIIPLLKEYFYNDYGKIRLVLGDDFVKEKDEDHRPQFAVDGGDLIPLRHTYELVPIDDNFPIIEALERAINGKA